MNHSGVRVVAVSDEALRSTLLDSLADDASLHDVVFVERLANAYKRICQLAPELIIVLMRMDDEAACQLLTMLALDRELLAIRVVTWTIDEGEERTDQRIGLPVSTGYTEMAHA
jgi:DNA-binding NarL/FixJ family response regulator